jgi:hypothetical protein
MTQFNIICIAGLSIVEVSNNSFKAAQSFRAVKTNLAFMFQTRLGHTLKCHTGTVSSDSYVGIRMASFLVKIAVLEVFFSV